MIDENTEEKVDELNHELAYKNKELELNLLEKERVKNYLSNIVIGNFSKQKPNILFFFSDHSRVESK